MPAWAFQEDFILHMDRQAVTALLAVLCAVRVGHQATCRARRHTWLKTSSNLNMLNYKSWSMVVALHDILSLLALWSHAMPYHAMLCLGLVLPTRSR